MAIRIDGNAIAKNIQEQLGETLSGIHNVPQLAVVMVGATEASRRYVAKKKVFAEAIGVAFVIHDLNEDISTSALRAYIEKLSRDNTIGGIVVQLPLPVAIREDTKTILSAIDPCKDPDTLSEKQCPKTEIYAPVAESVREIFKRHNVNITGKRVVVIGHGKLVGKPVAAWLEKENAAVTIIPKPQDNLAESTRPADIIITGAGSPHLVQPHMITEGVILIDAGTSGSKGTLKGDIDPACFEKSLLYTPVPGGIGPIAVAKLFENFVKLIG